MRYFKLMLNDNLKVYVEKSGGDDECEPCNKSEASKGLWHNLHEKMKRTGKRKLGKTGGGEGSTFSSKRAFKKVANKIKRNS